LQLSLPPEWKVYFTLWIQFIAARAGQAPLEEHTDLLRRLGRSSNWWGKLASFGAGDLDYTGLMSVASNLGEETEALYYEATRLFIASDRQAAHDQFLRVLETNMVSFSSRRGQGRTTLDRLREARKALSGKAFRA